MFIYPKVTTKFPNMFKNPKVALVIGILCLAVFMIINKEKPKVISEQEAITGLWNLIVMEVKDDNGTYVPWNGGMGGKLLYDGNGNGSLHLYTKDYKNYEVEFPNFTDSIPQEALKHLTNNYFYMANYNIDTAKNVIHHTRISHSNPKDWGKTVTRRYSFIGDTLVLVPAEDENANLRLKWVKN